MHRNEAEIIFRQTEKERKRIGRGAKSRKSGSRSKFCGLPSDNLSRAERMKLNGDVKVYNLNKPMKWDQFKKLPHDLRVDYIKKLSAMGANREDITDMLGIKPATYSAFMSHNHPGEKLLNGNNGYKNNEAFVQWYCEDGTQKNEKVTEPVAPEQNEKPCEKENKPKEITLDLKACEVTFFGNPLAVFEKIIQLMDVDKNYEITVAFKAESSDS